MKKSEVPRHQSAKAPKLIFFVKILNYIKSWKHLQERVQLDSICTCIQFALTLRITLLSVSTHWVQILSTFVNEYYLHVSTIENASANWVRVKIECNLHFFMRIANIRLNSIFCTKKSILVLLHFGALAPLTFSWRHPMPENNNKKRK